ncbi:effector-associated domain 2-containing protein [Bradyrhizobium cosmicum]|uniref:effector-associated domain 2-containing protein n=1 Tax=Bradyrhizobium cosmicum TaxID=1404864 RepID=UPI003A5CEA49
MVSARAGALASPAFRRLWRHAAEDHLGPAGSRHHLRARQWALYLVRAVAGREDATEICGSPATVVAGSG